MILILPLQCLLLLSPPHPPIPKTMSNGSYHIHILGQITYVTSEGEYPVNKLATIVTVDCPLHYIVLYFFNTGILHDCTFFLDASQLLVLLVFFFFLYLD